MPDFVSGAIGGSALLGAGSSIFSSNASRKAANTQADAAAANNALQEYIYNQNMDRYNQNREAMGSYANTYWNTTGTAWDEINQYLKELDSAKGQVDPYLQAGRTGLTGYQNLLNDPSSIVNNPGYQFRLGEGSKALERGAAARSGVLSGSAGKAMSRYGQDYASNEYGNALKNYLPMISAGQTGVSQLQGYEGLKGNAVNQKAGLTQNYLNLANLYGNQGLAFAGAGNQYANAANANNIYGANAQAGGYINQANAINGGIQSGLNNALMGYYMGSSNQNNALNDWTKSYFGW